MTYGCDGLYCTFGVEGAGRTSEHYLTTPASWIAWRECGLGAPDDFGRTNCPVVCLPARARTRRALDAPDAARSSTSTCVAPARFRGTRRRMVDDPSRSPWTPAPADPGVSYMLASFGAAGGPTRHAAPVLQLACQGFLSGGTRRGEPIRAAARRRRKNARIGTRPPANKRHATRYSSNGNGETVESRHRPKPHLTLPNQARPNRALPNHTVPSRTMPSLVVSLSLPN
jgi:hypothetical protein